MTPLESAARGAVEVGAWLESEGFDVACITDADDPVTGERVKGALRRFVTAPPRYHLLLVYFSGHGYWHARTDLWLLSHAPREADEAINLDGAMELARYSGIANVVFVSDACRSIPDARTGAFVRGIDAFPNFIDVSSLSKVDYFKATSDATQAYEAKIGARKKSVLTHALMSAYGEATPDMVLELDERGTKIKVVPNRRLERYLQAKVNATLARVDANLTQRIDVNVPSADDVYIARVRPPSPFEAVRPQPDLEQLARPTSKEEAIARNAGTALSRLVRAQAERDRDAALRALDSSTEQRVAGFLPGTESEPFESGCGFAVRGARVASALCSLREGSASAEVLDPGGIPSQPAIVHVRDPGAATTVFIRSADGRGIVLPALAGLIGHAVVDERGLAHLSFVPFNAHERESVLTWPRIKPRDARAQARWETYLGHRPAIDRLRALAAIAATGGTLRFASGTDAQVFADRIRMGEAPDPVLGLYAAQAFAASSLDGPLRRLADALRESLRVELFDMHALGSRRGEPAQARLAPACPLLTRTWNVLRPRGIEVPASLQRASAYLADSLWSTYEARGADLINQAMIAGEL